ncbi:hypothetical protein AO260_17735 [Pseudomonas sp. ABAC21]|nr:hypothetical protein AO260_17735 [Pseudomonas sp. ABAC21]
MGSRLGLAGTTGRLCQTALSYLTVRLSIGKTVIKKQTPVRFLPGHRRTAMPLAKIAIASFDVDAQKFWNLTNC